MSFTFTRPSRVAPRTVAGRLGAVAMAMMMISTGSAAVAGTGPVPQPAMGDPLLDLTPDELSRFNIARPLYDITLQEEDGLGPVFNKEGCGNCHSNPLGGTGSQTVTRFGQATKGGFDPLEQYGGSLLQAQTIDDNLICVEVIPKEANRVSLRVTNGMMGYGLVEAIPDADIEANELSPPLAGITGRVHWVTSFEDPDPQPLRAGRFGWKAQLATILSFSADAALNEMGFTNRFLDTENDPNGIRPPNLGDPDFCDTVPDPEDGPEGGVMGAPHFIDRVTDFQRFLAQPPQTPRSGMTGEAVFNSIGCNGCHVAQFTTSSTVPETALQSKTIRPYSDFLLHDIGNNADLIEQGDAGERELKTPPLWGVRRRDPVWHDGRFGGDTFENRMTAAILAHFSGPSEAIDAGVDVAWNALTTTEREQLFQFLDSLGHLEYDADGDNDVELDDFIAFAACYFGPQGYTPDDACALHDIDQDTDVDDDDYSGFLISYTGPLDDCNGNGIPDITDIINGTSLDVDANGIPDECTCTGDFNTSGDVGFADILLLFGQWGPCPGCPEDLDGSGDVGFSDVLVLIGLWGPCM